MRILNLKSPFLVLFLVSLFCSCVYEPIDGTVESNAAFKVDFNGKTWIAQETSVVISGNYIEISAVKANGEGFGILVEANKKGTYPANINLLAFTPAGTDYGFVSLNPDDENEDTGSITITKIDTEKKTISGTFSFKGYWSDTDSTIAPVLFTKGVFTDLPYITESETEDAFSAKVNGSSFVSTDIMGMLVGEDSDEWIAISAQDANMNTISVNVKNNLAPGEYTISSNRLTDKVQASYEDENDEYIAISGTVKIISNADDRIKGTFSFATNGASPFQITEGSFDVSY